MTRLRRTTGSWTAAVGVSTVVFVGLHAFDQVATALIAVTILSVTFSLVTIWRRSLTAAIVAHTVWNLSQFVYLHHLHHGA
jgi:membrane protease YdiL (CAAX protease family)